jgi:uncharacterized phage protein (TIGR02220 family)
LFIFDLLSSASSWAKTIIIEEETYYWVARQVIVEQLPILSLKTDTVYRHLKALKELGLITYVKFGLMDCINITEKGKTYQFGSKSDDSEVNNEQVGSKPRNPAEANPTYKTTITISPLDNKTEEIVGIIDYLNSKSGKKFKAVNGAVKLVRDRMNEGYSPEDIKKVIDLKCSDWINNKKMNQYLRPETLFGATKFSGYFGNVGVVTQKEQEMEDWLNEETPENDNVLIGELA